MKTLTTWVKNNKLATVLLVILALFFIKYLTNDYVGINMLGQSSVSREYTGMSKAPSAIGGLGMDMEMAMSDEYYPIEPESPPSTSPDRLVIKDTSLSMQVNEVPKSVKEIDVIASQAGGYLVSSNVSIPEGASSGTIVIRVPEENRTKVLDSIKALGVKVVSESVSGRDVTDEYIDIDARLDTLYQTKLKFEEILTSAEEVDDLLTVQRELIRLQDEIDRLKGRQQYLEQSARLSKITVYLSTDEYALPYTPDQPWRPEVIFKQAVRSLITSMRSVGSMFIWVFVYAIVWVPILLIIWLVMRKRSKNKTTNPPPQA